VFFRYRYLLEKNFDELTALVSKKTAKPGTKRKRKSKNHRIDGICLFDAAACFGRDSGSFARRRMPHEHFPVGVVASIVPFNFPLMVPNWTMPNALVLGNTMIMKPSELSAAFGR
jgi:malonate-semialdehyde dehydrogenase (acetylating)/methylmalonate-semialdehyde dehydrogenase